MSTIVSMNEFLRVDVFGCLTVCVWTYENVHQHYAGGLTVDSLYIKESFKTFQRSLYDFDIEYSSVRPQWTRTLHTARALQWTVCYISQIYRAILLPYQSPFGWRSAAISGMLYTDIDPNKMHCAVMDCSRERVHSRKQRYQTSRLLVVGVTRHAATFIKNVCTPCSFMQLFNQPNHVEGEDGGGVAGGGWESTRWCFYILRVYVYARRSLRFLLFADRSGTRCGSLPL